MYHKSNDIFKSQSNRLHFFEILKENFLKQVVFIDRHRRLSKRHFYILEGEADLRMYESKCVGKRHCIPNCVLALSNLVLYNHMCPILSYTIVSTHLDDVRGFLFFFFRLTIDYVRGQFAPFNISSHL